MYNIDSNTIIVKFECHVWQGSNFYILIAYTISSLSYSKYFINYRDLFCTIILFEKFLSTRYDGKRSTPRYSLDMIGQSRDDSLCNCRPKYVDQRLLAHAVTYIIAQHIHFGLVRSSRKLKTGLIQGR